MSSTSRRATRKAVQLFLIEHVAVSWPAGLMPAKARPLPRPTSTLPTSRLKSELTHPKVSSMTFELHSSLASTRLPGPRLLESSDSTRCKCPHKISLIPMRIVRSGKLAYYPGTFSAFKAEGWVRVSPEPVFFCVGRYSQTKRSVERNPLRTISSTLRPT